MAKKPKRKPNRKKQTKTKNRIHFEIIGLFFILFAIFSSGANFISDGFIPSILEYILRFILGMWYFIGSILLLILGIYIIIKKGYPKFITRKKTGLTILFLGGLLLTHIYILESALIYNSNENIINLTWTNFVNYINGTARGIMTAGGMTGAILLTLTFYLFSSIGAKIIGYFMAIIGVLMVTDLSLGELFKKIYTSITKIMAKLKYTYSEKRKHKKEEKSEQKLKEVKEEKEIKEEVKEKTIEKPKNIEPAVYYAYEENNHEQLTLPMEDEKEIIEPINYAEAENSDYVLPPMSILNNPTANNQQQEKSVIKKTVKLLEETFKSFGVKATISNVHVGPAVTKYEVNPEAGVKVSRIVNLHDDLALALAAQDIRIEAPIPGKAAVGIEVPNEKVAMVSLKEVIEPSTKSHEKLLFGLGRDISGNAIVGELNKMPHMLIAGATGSGKSVCINGIITSILMRAKPHEVKMMMIDPKKVELNVYNGIPHLLTPVVTDPKQASIALKKVVVEMERRYDLFSETGTRNLEGYNEYLKKENINKEDKEPYLPYIVVLVDELADLMMVASSEVEDAITRLAQMARAAGIHLIIATQRPSVDVITGVIKANIPSRIAFSVSSQIDSRTILDMGGAEKLLGQGDMLYIPVGMSKPLRVQGAFLSDEEVEKVVNHCISQQKASYQEEMTPEVPSEVEEEVDDELYLDAVTLIVEMQSASISMLQRRFRIGYNRAARLIDAMESRGVVGPPEGTKPRIVLIDENELSRDTEE